MTSARLRGLPAAEAILLGAVYLAGELTRGLARGGVEAAERHAASIVAAERRLHVFGEGAVQRAAEHVYGLPALLGYAYLSLHLVGTAGILLWVYRRRPHAYRRLRNALVLANALAVVGYAIFPTAPPRLAGVGVTDTVSSATSVNLGSAFAGAFYNPYAAVPSMHIGFSLLVGAAVWRLARRRVWRLAGAFYPVFVLFVIVATGNHFFLDAVAGAAVAVAAVAVTGLAATARRRPAPVPAHEFG